jgi:hypothetical protein
VEISFKIVIYSIVIYTVTILINKPENVYFLSMIHALFEKSDFFSEQELNSP